MWGPELITQAEALSRFAVSPPLAVMRVSETWLDRLLPALMLVVGGIMLAAGLTKPSFDTAWPRYLGTGIFYAIGLLSALTIKRAKQPESWFMAVSGGKLLLNTQDYILPPTRAEGATVLSLNLQNITALEPRRGLVLLSSDTYLQKGMSNASLILQTVSALQPSSSVGQGSRGHYISTNLPKRYKHFAQLIIHLSEPLSADSVVRLNNEAERCLKLRSRAANEGTAFLQRHALWTTDHHATLVVNLRCNTTPDLLTFLQALGQSVQIKPLQAEPFGDVPFAVLGYRGPIKPIPLTKAR